MTKTRKPECDLCEEPAVAKVTVTSLGGVVKDTSTLCGYCLKPILEAGNLCIGVEDKDGES